MWKIVALSTLTLLAAAGTTLGCAAAQTPQPREPVTRPGEATPAPTKARHASRHKWRRHARAPKCFAHEWRAFPTRDPNGYFYTPPGGGIC
jgi:hypothetical protein